ncbi:MAG: hypothetical protein IT557_00120 [Alphaproteobacteria bacterium]|nr:hypothetical protein [Alphaproteobacteria bacterium]
MRTILRGRRLGLLCAFLGFTLAGPAAANDPYSVCRVGLDANEPRAFIACIEPLRSAARDRLESYRQRLEVSEALIGKIIAQGGRDAPTACAQSRVTLAELEAEARRLGDLETEATALRDAWREAAVGLSRARGGAQLDQTTLAVLGYNMLAGSLVAEADALATSLRSARGYLVRVDPAGLCVGQPPPEARRPAGAAGPGGFAITDLPAVRTTNRGPRLPLVVRYSGTPEFPVNIVLAPRPAERGGCFDSGGPRNWSCGTERRSVVRAEQAGMIELRDAVWCETGAQEHNGTWTMRYEVTITDRRGLVAGPVGVDFVCDAQNIRAR